MVSQIRFLFILFIFCSSCFALSAEQKAAATATIATDSNEQFSTIYRDMIVAQPSVIQRKSKFFMGARYALDFSDGPQSRSYLTLTTTFGLSSSVEMGLYLVPIYLVQSRAIRKAVQKLDLAFGETADIVSATPTISYGAELLWLISYGKDTWGGRRLVRSDTFLRLTGGSTQFSGSKPGIDYGLSLGKTYYLNKIWNIRVCVGVASNSGISDGKPVSYISGLLDGGLVWAF